MPVKGLFKNSCLSQVGDTWETLYTCPTGETSILIELDVCNLLGSGVQASVKVVKGSDEFHVVFGAPVPPGSTLQAVSGQKIVLEGDDILMVKSNTPDSVDVIASIIEDINS